MFIIPILLASVLSRGQLITLGGSSGNAAPFGHRLGSDTLGTESSPAGCDWNPLPGDLTIERVGLRSSSAALANATYQMFKGIPASLTGSTVTLLSGNQDAEGAVAVTVSPPTTTGDLATQAFGWQATGGGAGTPIRSLFQYSVASPYDLYNIVASGMSDTDFFRSQATRYASPSDITSSTTEADTTAVVPTNGTFQYFLFVAEFATTPSDSTLTMTLFVNGSPTAITASMSNSTSPNLVRDVTHSVAVNIGDKFSFKGTTSGTFDANHAARVYVAIGFLPS